MTINPVTLSAMGQYASIEADRLRTYARNGSYYDGTQEPMVKPLPGSGDDDAPSNLCKIIVNDGISFLIGRGISLQIEGQAKDSPATKWLDAFWKENRVGLFLRNFVFNGAICGNAFAKLVVPEGWTAAASKSATPVFPRLIAMNPMDMSVVWDMEDVTRATEYTIEYIVATEVAGRMVPAIKRQRIILNEKTGTSWDVITEMYVSSGLDTGVSPLLLDVPKDRWQLISREVWPYPWAPIIDCQNTPTANTYYGNPDLTDDVIKLQDAINRNQSNIQRILRFYAHPLTVIEGALLKRGETGPGKLLQVQSGAKVYNVEAKSDLSSSRLFRDDMRRDLFSISRTTDPQNVAELKGDRITNFRVIMLFFGLMARSDDRWVCYGHAIEQISKRALELGGFPGLTVVAKRENPLPENMGEKVMLLQAEVATDVLSRRHMAEMLGYDYEAESEQIEAERAARMAVEQQYGKGAFDSQLNTADPLVDPVNIQRQLRNM